MAIQKTSRKPRYTGFVLARHSHFFSLKFFFFCLQIHFKHIKYAETQYNSSLDLLTDSWNDEMRCYSGAVVVQLGGNFLQLSVHRCQVSQWSSLSNNISKSA